MIGSEVRKANVVTRLGRVAMCVSREMSTAPMWRREESQQTVWNRRSDEHSTGRSSRARRARLAFPTVTAMVIASIALTACGSSSNNSSSGGGATGESTTASSSTATGVAEAAKEVKRLMAPEQPYKIASEPIDTSKLAGKTVVYIPVVLNAPSFQEDLAALREALGKVGVHVQACDGGGNPTQVSACVTQALGSGASGIVTDAVPYDLAKNAFDGVRSKGVPLLITNQIIPQGTKQTSKFAYVEGPSQQNQYLSDWIIADSNGTANTLIGMISDTESSKAYIEELTVPNFEQKCPECEVSVAEVSVAAYQRVAPIMSAALLKDPNADYVMPQFEAVLPGTQEAIQQAGRMGQVKVASASVELDEMKQIGQEGGLAAAIGVDKAFMGWADADQIMRMMTGMSPFEYEVPVRLFTEQNIGSVELTDAANSSGEWFGSTKFKQEFQELWGVNG
jgi:ribose transport system substrate-binding protein